MQVFFVSDYVKATCELLVCLSFVITLCLWGRGAARGVTRVCVRSRGPVGELSGGRQRLGPLSTACALARGHREQVSPLPNN